MTIYASLHRHAVTRGYAYACVYLLVCRLVSLLGSVGLIESRRVATGATRLDGTDL